VFSSTVTTPTSNEAYARLSHDLNPIHVNPYFSDLAELPDTITHGLLFILFYFFFLKKKKLKLK